MTVSELQRVLNDEELQAFGILAEAGGDELDPWDADAQTRDYRIIDGLQ